MRVRSIVELCREVDNQIETNKYYAQEQFDHFYCYGGEKYSEVYGKKVGYYEYEDGILHVKQDAQKSRIYCKAVDLSSEAIQKVQEVMDKYQWSIQQLEVKKSTPKGREERIKKELCEVAHYLIPAAHNDQTPIVANLVRWEEVKDLSVAQLHAWKWENYKVNWRNLAFFQLSEPFMREFQNELDWYNVANWQKSLSETFRTEFKNRLKGKT